MPSRAAKESRKYGAPMGAPPAETPAERATRPKAREASPEERRAAIAAATRAEARTPPLASREATADPSPTRDLSVKGMARRLGGRARQIDAAVEDAQK